MGKSAMPRRSCLLHLECSACGQTLDAQTVHNTCPACGRVLFARYDLRAAAQTMKKETLGARSSSLWRYFEILPVLDPHNVISLGEGGTPLLPAKRLAAQLGLSTLYIKEEGVNPTGTFKARGLSVAVSKAKELGVRALAIPSAGHAASALAAYAARAGIPAHVFLPKDAPEVTRVECTSYGAQVHLVDGLIDEAGRVLQQAQGNEPWFDVSTLREPYRVEGKKTMGLELAEQLGWKLPDVIIYPTGGGTGMVGMWKAFAELEEMGWIGRQRPQMVSVQASGCAPIVRAFAQSKETAEPWVGAHTLASGIRVPQAIGDYLILRALRESGGTAVAVSDEEMLDSMRELARWEGIFACPEGAATLAALKRLRATGFVAPEAVVVLFNTGSGLKYHQLFANLDWP